MAESLHLGQVGSQRVDQELADLRENAFNNAVQVENGLEECQRRIAELQHPVEGRISAEAYQERARKTEQAFEQCRSQMATQERKLLEG